MRRKPEPERKISKRVEKTGGRKKHKRKLIEQRGSFVARKKKGKTKLPIYETRLIDKKGLDDQPTKVQSPPTSLLLRIATISFTSIHPAIASFAIFLFSANYYVGTQLQAVQNQFAKGREKGENCLISELRRGKRLAQGLFLNPADPQGII